MSSARCSSEGVPPNQYHYSQVKQSAQPTMAYQQPLHDVSDGLSPDAGVRNR